MKTNAMGAATIISIHEYLSTTYRPDCDYIDGTLEERNAGRKDHSKLQDEILGWFRDRRRSLNMRAFPEQRIQVAPRRYRIPDVCVVRLPEPDEQIFTSPPYICIEILSPEDTFTRLQQRLNDYLRMGVPNIWVLDPALRVAWQVSQEGHIKPPDGILRSQDGDVALIVADLFLE